MQVGIYLAGAMRVTPEEEDYDRTWRTVVTQRMEQYGSDVLIRNPMDGKIVTAGCEPKLFGQFHPEPNSVLHHDFASIVRSDIIFMNLIPLTDKTVEYQLNVTTPVGNEVHKGTMAGGYPHIGTLSELGISYANRKLLVVVADNPYVIRHPFVRSASTRILPTLDDGIDYLEGLVAVLLGSQAK